jgi:hypothetical protein
VWERVFSTEQKSAHWTAIVGKFSAHKFIVPKEAFLERDFEQRRLREHDFADRNRRNFRREYHA